MRRLSWSGVPTVTMWPWSSTACKKNWSYVTTSIRASPRSRSGARRPIRCGWPSKLLRLVGHLEACLLPVR
jgi:hypothetical protein